MAIPVIVGLVVGAAFIMVFASSIFNSFEQKVTAKQNGVTISVVGLKTRYSAGEALNFAVTAKGYGKVCSPVIARIVNVNSGDEVEHFSKNFPNCNLTERKIDEKWTLHDIEGDSYFPLLVQQLHGSGHYRLIVGYRGATLEEDFIQD
ncbi:hypothetical protein [Candidatus Nitrososphaera evergladensis]|jgi:hypothetical protein|nr:hypothetical protein [Candidatus Nitrososphaera evergladensis]